MDSFKKNNNIINLLLPLFFISMILVSTTSSSEAATTVNLDCGSCTPAAPSTPKSKPVGILPPVIPKLPLPPVVPELPVPNLPVPKLPLPPVVPELPVPNLPVPKLPLPPVVPELPLPPVPNLPIPPVPKLPLPPVVPKLPVPLPPGKGKGCGPAPKGKKCPIDTLKLGACVDVLGGLVHIGVGDPAAVSKCCPLLNKLMEVEAAACLCTTLKLKALNLKLYVPIALQLLVTCGKTPPPGYTCSL